MITIILPIHEYNESIVELLNEAIDSVKNQEDFKIEELIVVFPTKIKYEIENHFKDSIFEFKLKLLENEGNFKFQDQINLAVESVVTPYFSILEFDDVYSKNLFRNVEKYIKSYPEVDLFLPFVVEGTRDKTSVKLINDHAWSKSHMESSDTELGFISVKSLQNYSVVNVTGGVFKTQSYKNSGGLKRNIELTFWYEMLLRMCNSGMKIFVIPRAGYKHIINRDNSLFMTYNNVMTQKEKNFWFETANKEYYFNNDRIIVKEI